MKYVVELNDDQVAGLRLMGVDTISLKEYELASTEEGKRFNFTPAEINEKYYSINADGDIKSVQHRGCNRDENRKDIGNMFRTHEEAEFMFEKLRTLAILRRYAEPEGTDIQDGEPHFYIFYDVEGEVIAIDSNEYIICQGLYFKTEELASKAVDLAGEENVKKYIFGITKTNQEN